MIRTCAHTKTRSSTSVTESSPKSPESESETGDQGQDEVGLAEVAALESGRPLQLADADRGHDADQHEHREDVHQQREPALVAEPRQRGVAVHRADHGDQDRGEENQEAPEDERVHQAGTEALEELALAQHDRRLVADAPGQVVEALARLAEPYQVDQELGPAREQKAAHGDGQREGDRSEKNVYGPRAFLSSAVTAGTISVRSPITA